MNKFCIFCFLAALYIAANVLPAAAWMRPHNNLSGKQLQELMNEIAETPSTAYPDTVYVPPTGARHTEIRSVNPSSPPAIIDITGNMNNKKLFKLSDFATSVRYVYLQPPPGIKFTTGYVVSDDKHIFINNDQGLFCYSTEGLYLYTVCNNQTEQRLIWEGLMGTRIVNGIVGNVDLLNGKLIFRTRHWPSGEDIRDMRLNVFDVKELDAQMRFNIQSGELKNLNIQPKYQRRLELTKEIGLLSGFLLMDDQSLFIENSLTGITVYGDTLCKFNDYDTYKIRPGQSVIPSVPSKTYRFDGNVMLKKSNNDTIFRVAPPNRLIPVYVMRWGEYKPDINVYMGLGNLEGKLIYCDWVETSRFIFIRYSEGTKSLTNKNQIKFHLSVYDKTAKTLTHHLTSGIRTFIRDTEIPPLFENNIDPVGMPFYPEGLNHRNEMYMTFNKEKVKDYIASGKLQNNKLQAICNNMSDDGFCLMIVK